MDGRRRDARAKLGLLLLNKYIDGFPHLVELLDLSSGGMLVRTILEPDLPRDFYSVELGIPGTSERVWLWTRCVWKNGQRQALRFVGVDEADHARVTEMVRGALRAA